jgi:hypothetical protein
LGNFPIKVLAISDNSEHFSFVSNKKERKQAGAELCQAQAQLALPAEAELILTIEFQISTSGCLLIQTVHSPGLWSIVIDH